MAKPDGINDRLNKFANVSLGNAFQLLKMVHQLSALHELHDDTKAVWLLIELIDLYYVRMVDGSQDIDFSLEILGIKHDGFVQNLYCHFFS